MNNNYDPDKQNSWGSFNNQYSNQNYPAYSGNNNYNPYGYTESNVPYQNMNNYSPSTPYFNNNLQNYGVEENQSRKSSSKIIDLQVGARIGFIRKVYTVLSIQLLATALMCFISMTSVSFFMFQLQNIWLMYVALIIAIIVQIYMFCCNGGRTFPEDWICVSVFTLAESYIVSFVCSATGMQSGNQIVFLAALMTFVIVFALTLYAMLTPRDFTTSCGIIVVLTVVLLILFIVMLFTDNKIVTMIYCGVGVFLFGLYLIIDTQMIMGGRAIQLGIDEYCLGAMMLYIDIIQMFLYILQFLRECNSE